MRVRAAGHYTKITFTNPEIPMCYLQPLENREIMQHYLNISITANVCGPQEEITNTLASTWYPVRII